MDYHTSQFLGEAMGPSNPELISIGTEELDAWWKTR